ncbi:MAG: hypothetical protein V5A62_13400 [Haloarculaceae archaeon]
MRAVFFLKHYNDIDHVVPVVHEGVTTNAFDAEVIVTTDESYLEDYRLRHIAGLDGAEVGHIEEYGLPAVTPPDPGPVTYSLKEVGKRLPTDLPRRAWHRLGVADRNDSVPDFGGVGSLVEDLVAGDERVVLALDWLTTRTVPARLEFTEGISGAACELDVPVVALPHGDAPYENRLFKRDSLDFDDALDQYRTGALFDAVAVPNRLCAKRYEPHLPSSRIPVLGSPRYNEQWLRTLPGLLPEQSLPSDGEVKLAFFLRDRSYAIHWSELERTIRLVAAVDGVELVVKRHTRHVGADIDDMDLSNVTFVDNEVHSPVLLEWADAALDVGTSVVFEPVMRETPVLEVEYLHPNRSTVASYVEGTAMHTRDDLYHAVRRLADDTAGFYDRADRDSFVRNVVEPAGRDVLKKYVDFLSTIEPDRTDR